MFLIFAFKNNIKLIYSATSASLGNKGKDKNLSPYAFSKAKNLEILEILKKWFNFNMKLSIFIMFMVPHQICKGPMSTVIGIFEDHYKKKKKLYRLLDRAHSQDDLHTLMTR